MKQTEHAASRLIEWLADFKAEAVQRGKMRPAEAIYVGLYHDGTGTITVAARTFSSSTAPILEAFQEANRWLMRDNVVEQNATLGLNPDGTFASSGISVDYGICMNYQEIHSNARSEQQQPCRVRV